MELTVPFIASPNNEPPSYFSPKNSWEGINKETPTMEDLRVELEQPKRYSFETSLGKYDLTTYPASGRIVISTPPIKVQYKITGKEEYANTLIFDDEAARLAGELLKMDFPDMNFFGDWQKRMRWSLCD